VRGLVLAIIVGLSAVLAAEAPPGHETRSVPGLGTVTVYTPASTPAEVVVFVSGDGGWNKGVVDMADRLRQLGALVIGIDIRQMFKTFDNSSTCGYPAGQLEELARSIEIQKKLPEYKRPILVGYSSGATLVYAALVAAPPETFAGAISLGFCPTLEVHRPLCQMRGLSSTKAKKSLGFDLAPFKELTVPWIALQGDIDQVCSPSTTSAFVSSTGNARLVSLPRVGHGFAVPRNWDAQFVKAYRSLAGKPADAGTAAAPAVRDLAVVEVPATSAGPVSDSLAIILTGDGGWAEIDKGLGAALAARGVPSIGWSSLRYYWTPRMPDDAANDLGRILRYYLGAWKKQHVLVVGYSFGADIAPFLVNRLPTDLRSRVTNIGLLGLSGAASFEFHVTSWLGVPGGKRWPTGPEIRQLGAPVTCVLGEGETESGCRDLSGANVSVRTVGRGHHFSGEYGRIIDLMLADAQTPPATARPSTAGQTRR